MRPRHLSCVLSQMAVSVKSFLILRLWPFLLFALSLSLHGQSDHGYVGAAVCAKCHAQIHQEWRESFHSKMMQPATEASVKGDFSQSKVELHGSNYQLQNRAGNYYITESDLTGKPWQHLIDYTLGSRRVQHYLTTLPDGRIVILPPAWDNITKKWVHEADIQNPEEDTVAPAQVWNKTCYSCHVSQAHKNFDAQENRYHTTWQDLGINCETCHGPGREHISLEQAATPAKVPSTAGSAAVINPSRLDATQSTMICAQCHSFRDIYVDGFQAGGNYYDFFLPVMEYRLPSSENPAYWPDGHPRWLSNEAIAFWQSQCFLKGGATCATCHSRPHKINVEQNPQLRPANNALCTSCHKAIAANTRAHTHHSQNSSGSSCIECHMPSTVIGINTYFRDHSISLPVPENTIRHSIPNACNLCHKDKDASWALRQTKVWYGDGVRQKLVAQADSFSAARDGRPEAVQGLLQITSDTTAVAFIRANAIGYLAAFPNDPVAYDAVFGALSDAEPLVRATAAFEIRPRAAQREAAAPQLALLLRDPIAAVRVSAAIALVAMGVTQLPSEDEKWFARANELYAARAELNSDDANQQFAAGKFFFLAGAMERSAAAFRATLKLDSTIPAQYYLGRALAEKGDSAEARKILETIPANDRQYPAAQQLLASLTATDSAKNAAQRSAEDTDSGEAHAAFAEGQAQYRNENYGAALTQLEQALELAPQTEWTTKAQIYRAICLEKLGRTQEAETAMQILSGNDTARTDLDLQLAFAELLLETGRPEEALKPIDSAIAVAPQSAMAYFWRAKVLLELHRTNEAAVAAQESVRLAPDLPAAHNLLIKIYQLQGRTKEAAQEAEWLRDYQRRIESR